MVALATLLCCHALPLLALGLVRQLTTAQRRRQQGAGLSARPGQLAGAGSDSGSSKGNPEESPNLGGEASETSTPKQPPSDISIELTDADRLECGDAPPTLKEGVAPQSDHTEGSPASSGLGPAIAAGAPVPAMLVGQPTTARPEVPLQRCLSARLEAAVGARPRLARGLALAALTVSATTGTAAQVMAPGFVDAPIGEPGRRASDKRAARLAVWVAGCRDHIEHGVRV